MHVKYVQTYYILCYTNNVIYVIQSSNYMSVNEIHARAESHGATD